MSLTRAVKIDFHNLELPPSDLLVLVLMALTAVAALWLCSPVPTSGLFLYFPAVCNLPDPVLYTAPHSLYFGLWLSVLSRKRIPNLPIWLVRWWEDLSIHERTSN